MTMAKFKPKCPLASALGKFFGSAFGLVLLFTWAILRFALDVFIELSKLCRLFIVAFFIGGGLTAGAVIFFATIKYWMGF